MENLQVLTNGLRYIRVNGQWFFQYRVDDSISDVWIPSVATNEELLKGLTTRQWPITSLPDDILAQFITTRLLQ